MANVYVQGVLLLVGVLSCCYGMYSVYSMSSNIVTLIYSSMWFILGLGSNLTGLMSVILRLAHLERMTVYENVVQYHYLCSWLTVTVGYPTLVTQFWMNYSPTLAAHILVALSAIPMVAWAMKNNPIIVGTTQMVTALAIVSHIWICYLAGNIWGLLGAAIMFMNIVSISLPTRYNLLGITTREAFMIGIASDSYIFYLAVSEMIHKHDPKIVPVPVPVPVLSPKPACQL